MSEERVFGAIQPDGVRHSVYGGARGVKFGEALCDPNLHVAWCEPLRPGQRTCNRQPCKAHAESSRAAQAIQREG